MDSMDKAYASLITAVGEDLGRPGLDKTPHRAAEAFRYLCKGYGESLQGIVNGAIFPSDNDEMVIVKDIELYSLCEHHLLPFIGKAHVAYLPSGKVIGWFTSYEAPGARTPLCEISPSGRSSPSPRIALPEMIT